MTVTSPLLGSYKADSNLLINGIYPIQYFMLPGTDEILFPDQFWWSSKQRFASISDESEDYLSFENGGTLTSEVLEIDLGRIREINYVNLDILRAPIDVFIDYDIVSSPDRESSWVRVSAHEELAFDERVVYDADNKNGWFNADFAFTDPKGDMVHTRYLRITFQRRDEPWPVATSSPFKWPIFAKHLRLGRYIADYSDTVGPLLTQDTPAELTEETLTLQEATVSHEIRQQFVIPPSSLRGEIVPNILGFGILIRVPAVQIVTIEGEGETEVPIDPEDLQDIDIGWSLWDVSLSSQPQQLRNGAFTGVITAGDLWVDWYLENEQIVTGNISGIYELRVFSRNIDLWNKIFTAKQHLYLMPLPGQLDLTLNSDSVATTEDLTTYLRPGDWFETLESSQHHMQVESITPTTITTTVVWPAPSETGSANKSYPMTKWDVDNEEYVQTAEDTLVMRVWSDIADEGRDVLGNVYRYGVRRDKASYVMDHTQAGWMSEPAPSSDAVEALYFDVRDVDPGTDEYIYRVIDGMKISPRTPGVRMNVYSSREALEGMAPETASEWDNLLWTPVAHNSFILKRNHLIDFPTPIRASYVKLEFTFLNPLPWRVPNFPPLPPKRFRRFPTWVEDQFTNSQLRNVIDDWFLRTATPIQLQALEAFTNPVMEFEYKQREFLSALALGTIRASQLPNNNLVDISEKSVIDPTTGSKIWIYELDQYRNSLLVSVDQDSVLGKAVVARFDPNVVKDPLEHGQTRIPGDAIPTVSSVNDRITESYSHLASIPMRFNRTARHSYREDMAEFNKKGYFVGIEEVSFLRAKYEQKHDDEVITVSLYDNEFLDENTWSHELTTSIEDGQAVYVTYRVGETDYEDEEVVLGLHFPVILQGKGADIFNIKVYRYPEKQGAQYFNGDDYVISQGFDADGVRIWKIARTTLTERLAVPEQTFYFIDAGIVIGKMQIPGAPSVDAAVVTGVAFAEGLEQFGEFGYGEGEYGADTGTYGRLPDV